MAEAQLNPLRLGGYNDEFVEEIEDDWLCPICTLPLKEAVQTRRCGHRLCKACIDAHFARQGTNGQQSTCPVCRTNLDREQDIFEDLAADRKIRSYTIKCPNRGCQWRGELREKNGHLVSCPHKIVPCVNENCDVKVKREGLQDHVTRTCLWRILRCKFCAFQHPALQTRAHQKVCPKVPVTCPRKCGMMIWREKVADHKENHCALVKISCPYFKLGCREKFQRKEKISHLQSCIQLHLDLACMKLADTEEELRITKEQGVKLEHRIIALENRVCNLYTWKIGGFQEILTRAKIKDNFRIESDPFYTGECDYKFRLRLYPNGCQEGENTHLSLFLANIEGEYDAILQWPCTKEAKLTLIDQRKNLDDRQTVSISFTRREELWRLRPSKGEENYMGVRKFVSHDELQKGAYIVDDTIFIQAKFE